MVIKSLTNIAPIYMHDKSIMNGEFSTPLQSKFIQHFVCYCAVAEIIEIA